MTFTWSNGRQLSHFAGGSEAAGTAVGADYTYGADGYRTKKVVTNPDGTVTTTTFHVEGTTLLGETRVTMATIGGVPAVLSTVELVYLYDHTGSMYGFVMTVTGGAAGSVTSAYYYQRNLQGDVIGLLDASGAMGSPAFSYAYDPWGKLISIKDSSGNAVTDAASPALINPIRYRGYYFDDESGLYYLQSRYYDPEVGRFINADAFVSTGQGLLGTNMFAYCGNNPVNNSDPSGRFFISALLAVVAVAVIATVASGCSAKPEPSPEPYQSADEAAKAFSESMYSKSLYIRHEYSTQIYSRTINGKTTYNYTTPNAGAPHSVSINTDTPSGTTLVAYAHTHPNSNYFSSTDIKAAGTLGINAYVVGPNLQLQRYDLSSRTTTNVCTISRIALTPSQKKELVARFRVSWDNHIAQGCEFNCGSMTWPTP